MTLGSRIKQAREALGWDLPRLAKESGIPYPTLAGIEGGNQRTSTKTPQLAETLGVSAVWLATGKPSRDLNVKQRPGEMRTDPQNEPLDPAMMGQALFWLDFLEFDAKKRGLRQSPPPRRGEHLIALYRMVVENGGELTAEDAHQLIESADTGAGHGGNRKAGRGNTER